MSGRSLSLLAIICAVIWIALFVYITQSMILSNIVAVKEHLP